MRFFSCRVLLGSAICALLVTTVLAKEIGWNGEARAPRYRKDVFPPWQHGANNDAANRGLDFTVPEVDVLADSHGDLTDPKLAPSGCRQRWVPRQRCSGRVCLLRVKCRAQRPQ
jgi:hypothetical protein